MGLNPFGADSDSVHAWKERYKQQQFQNQTLQSQLTESKGQLSELQVKFEEIHRQLKSRDQEISEMKQEIKLLKEINQDKESKIQELEQIVDLDKYEHLQNQNMQLKSQVEELQAQLIRGGTVTSKPESTSTSIRSDLTSALIPVMLHEYDPTNDRYQDAFINLVETIIQHGDAMSQIIGILVKYGGEGPVGKVRSMILPEEFDIAIEILESEGVISQIEGILYLNSAETAETEELDLNQLSIDELFEYMLYIANRSKKKKLTSQLRVIRDVLQNRNFPLTTIFFEIRKTIERIEKDQLVRPEIVDQIKSWQTRYHSLT